MSPTISDHTDYLTRYCQRQESQIRALQARLERIHEEAEAELARVEQHGGCSGFPLRIERLSRKVGP